MDLIAKRAEADELRAQINELVTIGGELTDSQVGDLEQAETRLLETLTEIRRGEVVERARKAADAPTYEPRGPVAGQVETSQPGDPYDQARRNMLADLRGETRAYNTSDDSSLIPTDLQDTLIRRLAGLSAVRSAANVQVFANDAQIPSIATRVSAAALVAEAASFTAAEGTYTKIDVKNFKTAFESRITIEMLQDNRGGLLADVLDQHLEAHAEGWDALYLSTEAVASRDAPAGLCATAANVNTGSNSNINDVDAPSGTDTAVEVDIDDLIATMNGLPGRYRTGQKSWIMSPAVHAAVVSSTDTNSRLVFLPQATGTVQDNPLAVGTILGYPVYLSDNMPSEANDAVAAILLDRRSYMIADRAQFQTLQDPYLYGNTGEIALRSWVRSDGLWTLPEASARLIYNT
jgi:HK97 family phage major capsid protein